MRLEKKIAIVTGAGGGFGEGIARRFAVEGARVAIVDLRAEAAVGSTAGLRPRPGLTWYNASKGAVNLVSKSLAIERAPWTIRVNSICPVMGETGLLEAFMGVPDTTENRAKFVATIPLGRMSRPADIANAALQLASDEADFITGVESPVDGGRTI